MNTLSKKCIGSICALVVVAGVLVPTAPRAQAFVSGTIIIEEQPFTTARILEGVGWMVAKTAVNSLTQSVVNWINSGFEGSPAFVSDLNDNLGSLADTVAEDFISGLDQVIVDNTGLSIRSPFQDQLAAALREEYYRTTSSYGFDARNPYTLGTYSNDPAAFTGGTFKEGGYSAWFELIKPENNPYGRYTLAREELFRRLNNETQNRLRELDWGNGFLSWRGPCGPHGQNAQAAVKLGKTDTTVGCRIRTPGTVVEQQLVQSLGSGVRQLELADNINEVVGALMTQLVNQVLGGGGLSGVSQPAPGGGSSYIDRAGNPSTSLSGGFAQNISDTRTKITAYQTGWQRIRDAAQAAQQACSGNSAKAAQAQSVLDTATARYTEATTALTTLASIEAERVRLSSSTSGDSTAVTALVARFTNLLSGTGALAAGEVESQDTGTTEPGSLYSQMQQLAAECR